jgi:1-acyl-sn-glycerol-3-phosphate acyltransferase
MKRSMLPEVGRRTAPRSGLRHHVAAVVLKLGGWTREGAPPDLPRFVIVAAPHTSQWDGLWMLAFAWWWGLRVRWIVKSTLSGGLVGWFLARLGAVPVDRTTSQGQVGAVASALLTHLEIVLPIFP